jgi:hypothetical protein
MLLFGFYQEGVDPASLALKKEKLERQEREWKEIDEDIKKKERL